MRCQGDHTAPLIIGQAPARGNDGKLPFAGQSGARLARLARVGDSGDALPEHFDLVNLMPYWPGKRGKGDEFHMQLAKENGLKLLAELNEGPPRKILMMGRKVRRAMGCNGDWEYLRWFPFWKHQAVVFPHPSGVNRWWNDPMNEHNAQVFLERLLRG